MSWRSSAGVGAIQRRSPSSSSHAPAASAGPRPTARVADGTSPAARTGQLAPVGGAQVEQLPLDLRRDGAHVAGEPRRGEQLSCTKRALRSEKNSPPSPPVFITSTSSPSGSTVTSPPPTSFSSLAWAMSASPMESSTIITPTPRPVAEEEERGAPGAVEEVAEGEEEGHGAT
jgi:hypothetical protein